jgi:hypothetical protein
MGSKKAPNKTGVVGRGVEPVPGLKKVSSRLQGGQHKAALKALRKARCPDGFDVQIWWRCYRDMAHTLADRSGGATRKGFLRKAAEADEVLAGLQPQTTTSQNRHPLVERPVRRHTADERRADSASFIKRILAERSASENGNGHASGEPEKAWY